MVDFSGRFARPSQDSDQARLLPTVDRAIVRSAKVADGFTLCPRVLVETNTSDISVGLGPLAPNGGPLQGSTDLNVSLKTLALTPTSPAIDAVLGACPAADERGTSRPQDGDNSGSIVCDIGAFELVPRLTVDKTCAIVPPPAPLSCSQPFKTLQMQWLPGSMKTGQNTQ